MGDDTLRLPPANRTLLSDQVVQSIRSVIIDGSLNPGKRLVEGELAEMLQVSRGPVREALRRLEQEGLVRIVPAGGTFVATITEEDIGEIYGVRAAVEGYAARIVVASGADDGRLDGTLGQMNAALVAGDLSGMIEADVVFHRTLVSLADNRRLLTVWESLEGQVRLILSLTRDQVYGDPRDLVEQHAALTAALRSKDGGRAEAQVRSHIEGRIGERQAYWRDTNARQAPMNVAGR